MLFTRLPVDYNEPDLQHGKATYTSDSISTKQKRKENSLPLSDSEDPQRLSMNTLTRKSPSSPWSKVHGTMQYRPAGNRILLLTSLRFMNPSTRPIWF